MTDSRKLSRRERQLMDLIYALGAPTTAEIRERMEDPPSGNAVRALLQILEAKGHIHRRKIGREYRYEPRQPRARAGFKALQHVLETFYQGSLEEALAAHFAKRKTPLDAEETRRLQKLIDDARNENSSP